MSWYLPGFSQLRKMNINPIEVCINRRDTILSRLRQFFNLCGTIIILKAAEMSTIPISSYQVKRVQISQRTWTCLFNVIQWAIFFSISISGPVTTIHGGTERHIKFGSKINLTCEVQNYPGKLNYIVWYKNKQVQPIHFLLYFMNIRVSISTSSLSRY